MKKFLLPVLALIAILGFNACGEKQDTLPCNGTAALPVNIRLVNAANQDLLKSGTAGSYSIANMSLTFTAGGQNYSLPLTVAQAGQDTFYLKTEAELWSSGGQEMYLKLSATDTDTLYVRNDLGVDGANCKSYSFVSFKYNGTEVPRNNATSVAGGIFQVKK